MRPGNTSISPYLDSVYTADPILVKGHGVKAWVAWRRVSVSCSCGIGLMSDADRTVFYVLGCESARVSNLALLVDDAKLISSLFRGVKSDNAELLKE